MSHLVFTSADVLGGQWARGGECGALGFAS